MSDTPRDRWDLHAGDPIDVILSRPFPGTRGKIGGYEAAAQVCEVHGCFSQAVCVVTKDTRVNLVCRRCAHEMVALFGWTLE